MENCWLVYILECADGSLYTGITDNLPRRLEAHRNGKGAKYTRGRGPLKLRYQQVCESHSQALKREFQIKQLTRQGKLELCKKDGKDYDL
jgi:putative endonuclease